MHILRSILLLSFLVCKFVYLHGHLWHVNMGIVTAQNYTGDREVAWRIKIAAERLGWSVALDESGGINVQNQQLDWVICMIANNELINPWCPNYLMVFHPFWYLNEQREFLPFCEKYDGYLLTIHDRDTLKQGLEKKNKKLYYTPFFPTVYNVPYKQVDLNELVVMIPVWSNRLVDPKFKKLYKLLSETGQAVFYGRSRNEDIISEGYRGPIPFDGVSTIEILQKHGIVFVFHSDIHIAECIPSSRIFEATAASAVIISDENPFVKQHFGDTVFYIDTSLSSESICDQILQHLRTIHQNPKVALEMAEKAHKIFIDNFTMEDQLLKIQQMHQKFLANKNK